MEAKRIWQSMYKFPTAIGVIDCTRIGILKPNQHGDEYINRKEEPTLNVQATCDAREMFTSVDASWPGSVHDSKIWRNSQTRSQLINKVNVLLGDDGYGTEPCLMTPFRNPTPGAEINYTMRHGGNCANGGNEDADIAYSLYSSRGDYAHNAVNEFLETEHNMSDAEPGIMPDSVFHLYRTRSVAWIVAGNWPASGGKRGP
ncbi:unnamed protein product [Acanthoscelides obtectus]|uniref:Putative nuclease HARBI1 n=1 Tax=Acanthoscelides obtectus TaxID=200917 RepID=A0A9P0PI78_ACAOB|nr:unnamed protein product [Acanthoscelides obtectus]CAK1649513.1 Putative nuclease HARBI1 [Acanthoscelides obtectus]